MFGSKLETAQSPVAQALIWDSGTDAEAERKHKCAQQCTGFMVDPEMAEVPVIEGRTSTWSFCQTTGPEFNLSKCKKIIEI